MKRPFRVTFLAIIVVVYAVINGLRLGETIFFWKTFEKYGVNPLYIAMSGGVWVIAGLFLAWGLWQGKAWGWAATIGGTLGYTAWYWFDRLVLQEPHANWPFILITNFVFLLLILIILFSRKSRLFFQRDAYERKP